MDLRVVRSPPFPALGRWADTRHFPTFASLQERDIPGPHGHERTHLGIGKARRQEQNLGSPQFQDIRAADTMAVNDPGRTFRSSAPDARPAHSQALQEHFGVLRL
jgi:hypothetical protein